MMAERVASLFGELDLKDNMTPALKEARKGLSTFSNNLKSVGRDVSGLGRNIMGFTAPLAAGFGAAVHSAMRFDNTMTNTASLMGRSRAEMVELNDEILRIGGRSLEGVQATGLAMYDIVSGVQDATTHMAILNNAIVMSEAGQASLVTSTSALIDSMNSYGFGAEQASYVTDVFTRTVGMGKTTLDQLASAMPAVLGLASEIGVPLHDVGAAMAFMTTQGKSASVSSTQLNAVMMALLNPTTDLEKAIKAMGYESGRAMIKAKGLDGALAEIKEYGGGAFDGLITGTEAMMGAIDLTKDSFGEFKDSYMEGLEGIGVATQAFQLDSPTAQFKLLTSGIEEMGIRIGTALLPALNDLLVAVQPVVAEITNWIGQNPEAVQAFAGLAIGAMALGAVLVPLGMVIKGLGVALGVAGVAGGVLAGVIGLINTPVVLLGAGLAGLLSLFLGDGGLVGGLNRAWVAFTQLTQLGVYAFLGALNALANTPFIQSVRDTMQTALDAIRNAIQTVITTFDNIGTTIQALIDNPVFDGVRGVFEGMASGIQTALGPAIAFIQSVGDRVREVLETLGLLERQAMGHGSRSLNELMTGTQRAVIDVRSNAGQYVAPTPLPQRALGGRVRAGSMSLVGEDGPEILKFGAGGMVFSNPRTVGGNNYGNRMMGGGGGGVNIGVVHVHGVQDAQRLLDELERIKTQRGR